MTTRRKNIQREWYEALIRKDEWAVDTQEALENFGLAPKTYSGSEEVPAPGREGPLGALEKTLRFVETAEAQGATKNVAAGMLAGHMRDVNEGRLTGEDISELAYKFGWFLRPLSKLGRGDG